MKHNDYFFLISRLQSEIVFDKFGPSDPLIGLQNAKSIFERLEEHTGQFASNFGITKEDMVPPPLPNAPPLSPLPSALFTVSVRCGYFDLSSFTFCRFLFDSLRSLVRFADIFTLHK